MKKKHNRVTALAAARRIQDQLSPYCRKIEIAGSLRRGRPHVSDIEIVAIPNRQPNLFGEQADGETLLDRFLEELGVVFTKNGEKYKQFTYGRFTVDLFLATENNWGSIFTIRTGSGDFSHWLVTPREHGGAMPYGWRHSGGMLWHNGAVVPTPTEDELFEKLGLPYIPVNMRDDRKWEQLLKTQE